VGGGLVNLGVCARAASDGQRNMGSVAVGMFDVDVCQLDLIRRAETAPGGVVLVDVRTGWCFQPEGVGAHAVEVSSSSIFSAGFAHPSVLRGRRLSSSAIWSSSTWV